MELDYVAKRLRELREKTGLSQYALAKRAKVSQGVLSQVENGKRSGYGLSIATLHKLAHALGVSVADIAGTWLDVQDKDECPAGVALVGA